MATKKVTLDEALKKPGKSRLDRLLKRTPEQRRRAAEPDPDNPILTEEELQEFDDPKPRSKKREDRESDAGGGKKEDREN